MGRERRVARTHWLRNQGSTSWSRKASYSSPNQKRTAIGIMPDTLFRVQVEEVMAEENGIASGFIGMFNAFVDPQGLAKRVPAKWFWVGPVITVTIIFVVVGYLMAPFTSQMIDVQMAQRNMPPEQLEKAKSVAHIIGKVTMFAIPVFMFLFLMLGALLVNVTASMVGLRTKFRDIFS